MWSPLLQNDWVQFWNQTINFEDIYLLDIIVSIGAVWSSTDSQVKCGVQEIISTSREDLNYNQNRCSVNTTQIYHFSYIYCTYREKYHRSKKCPKYFWRAPKLKGFEVLFYVPFLSKRAKNRQNEDFLYVSSIEKAQKSSKKMKNFHMLPLVEKAKNYEKKRGFSYVTLYQKS